MDRDIRVVVENRVATAVGDPVIICGNSDYTITFAFDDEWADVEVKTAIFKWLSADGVKKHEQPFTSNVVEVPILADTREVEVGVYAGNLTTTTGAPIRCLPCIRCGAGEKVEPRPDKYDELMELIKGGIGSGGGLTEEQAAALAANTEARHEHDNKAVLDQFEMNYAKTGPAFKGESLIKASDLSSAEARLNTKLYTDYYTKQQVDAKLSAGGSGGGVRLVSESYTDWENGNLLVDNSGPFLIDLVVWELPQNAIVVDVKFKIDGSAVSFYQLNMLNKMGPQQCPRVYPSPVYSPDAQGYVVAQVAGIDEKNFGLYDDLQAGLITEFVVDYLVLG